MHCYGKMRTEHILFSENAALKGFQSVALNNRSCVPSINRVGTDYKAHAPTKSGQYIK